MTNFPQLHLEDRQTNQATIQTNMGEIDLVLFEDQAPKTVKNFIALAKKGYYDGVIFHRVIPNFMIQAGDPTGSGMGGESIYGHPFEDEFSMEVFNLKGALSMANSGPNTNGSQFFIVTNDQVPKEMLGQLKGAGFPDKIIEAYKDQGGTPWLDHKHTVFGHVTSGLKVAQAISQVSRNSMDKPLDDVVIDSIEIKE
ncbi:Putative peptidyl-prolyl cis-trans isomerase [Alloiococcus otitis]|uniref:Peptidyl-prolyl cis-trans isomerase n=1 Tax=Alloiococcus otitis ATCC 51267 TaxID=883081 RepID=K9E9Z9_9LACT|nr:peptidylprolyl isomerase [Alloiococcus otitis]EKU93518.1 hypothetical protein HMPREF9698_00934 [Alloiococcus otitis ATCC 51267]SUU81402.1 Putative peptidyl-prolyl cis-trans isomerase [Alloiococcus otitis]